MYMIVWVGMVLTLWQCDAGGTGPVAEIRHGKAIKGLRKPHLHKPSSCSNTYKDRILTHVNKMTSEICLQDKLM